jgi:hypothetical protein
MEGLWSWFNENIVQPVNKHVIEPVVQPVVQAVENLAQGVRKTIDGLQTASQMQAAQGGGPSSDPIRPMVFNATMDMVKSAAAASEAQSRWIRENAIELKGTGVRDAGAFVSTAVSESSTVKLMILIEDLRDASHATVFRTIVGNDVPIPPRPGTDPNFKVSTVQQALRQEAQQTSPDYAQLGAVASPFLETIVYLVIDFGVEGLKKGAERLLVNSSQQAGTRALAPQGAMRGVRPATGAGGQSIPIASDLVEGRLIGQSPLAPNFYSIPNQNGGRVWVSQVPINQAEFAGLVNTRNARGPVTVLTGTHGGPNGGFGGALRETGFFLEDVAAWGHTPGVSVVNVNGLGAGQLSQLVNGEGRIIIAWCDSERAGRILRALGYLP